MDTKQVKGNEEFVKNREELLELLENIRSVEIIARNNYENDTITFKNFIITDTIEEIRKDEEKHIAMLESLIDMLKKGRNRLSS